MNDFGTAMVSSGTEHVWPCSSCHKLNCCDYGIDIKPTCEHCNTEHAWKAIATEEQIEFMEMQTVIDNVSETLN
jgi:hypothetical protein